MKQPLPQSRLESPGQQLHALSTAAAPLPGGQGLCARHTSGSGRKRSRFPAGAAEAQQPARWPALCSKALVTSGIRSPFLADVTACSTLHLILPHQTWTVTKRR